MKSIMGSQMSYRCVEDYYLKCLEKFIPTDTDNKNIRQILNLNDKVYTKLKPDDNMRIYLSMFFTNGIIIHNGNSTILWKYIENIINIPDDEMTPEVIELMQYILKVLY